MFNLVYFNNAVVDENYSFNAHTHTSPKLNEKLKHLENPDEPEIIICCSRIIDINLI